MIQGPNEGKEVECPFVWAVGGDTEVDTNSSLCFTGANMSWASYGEAQVYFVRGDRDTSLDLQVHGQWCNQ